ncbi:MAG TPA: CHAD domain-containing protein [Anaerolineaceae bacterium]|nr:CHAD domain-containing protein [Anaerolineaceae bacterium]
MAKSDGPVAVFGAGVLLKHLNALTQEVDGVRSGADIEPLHRMRVASRRLRAVLPLFARPVAPKQARRWKKEVRRITRALGPARDADVQIEQLQAYLAALPPGPQRPGIRRLILRQTQQREKLQPNVDAALDRFLASGIVEKMTEACSGVLSPDLTDAASPRLYHLAHRAVREKLSRFQAYEQYVDQPERVDELHAMRIAAKRLRYTLETFAPQYDGSLKPYLSAVKEAQELLGQIHDCDVWSQQLPAFMETERSRSLRYFGHERPFKRLLPGLLAFQADLADQRTQTYARFCQRWAEWRSAGLWEDLLETVQRPVWPERPEPQEPGEVLA